ncbi:MAG: response regulator [Gammaproteobacteria bacterium]|nr:response regulator [Gammaproteobacteria bacterium]MDH3449635.1 response regulator [Gammaproteobacteria bacterium]
MPAKRRILLIDSSDSARTILFKEISSRAPELDIIACGSGKEAMTAVKRFEFEIITTGISLPDTDGYELIEEIRQTPKNKDTAIFVVSGDTDTRVMGGGMEDTDAVTAYFDKAEGHRSLVNFILNFLGTQNELPVKILYVDKSATSTAITTGILEKNGIEYVHFREASQALECLQQDLANDANGSFDVMITDLMLTSQTNGYELIQTVRNELELDYLRLPILLMTIEPGEDERTDFTAIFGAGTNDFITKPVDEDDLLARLQTLVNIKRQSEALNP